MADKLPVLPASSVTDERLFAERRRLLRAPLAVLGTALGSGCGADTARAVATGPGAGGATLSARSRTDHAHAQRQTPFELATRYNNFYELGLGKEEPAENAHRLRTAPWSVAVGGACHRPATVGLEDLVDFNALEERVYRLRCVEAWSMVIPWLGVPLGPLLDRFEPSGAAKYVAFDTLADPEQMPGLRSAVLQWPYTEGLRLDEARHPLAFLAVGQYGRVLPGQSGAPLRLVIPWKYGFKSIKSIVAIRFSEEQPPTSWNRSAPHEYGFYANVNPAVDHPRWSQARERRIDGAGGLLNPKIDTLAFNGYAEQVAGLYNGMDLFRYF